MTEYRRSMAVLVRQAVDEYLARHFRDSADWGERFDTLVARIQGRLPAGLTPEQIEADVTAARAEVRQVRRGERNRQPGGA